MSTLLEDDYAPATRNVWPSILTLVLIVALGVFMLYRWRDSEPEHPLRRVQARLGGLVAQARGD